MVTQSRSDRSRRLGGNDWSVEEQEGFEKSVPPTRGEEEPLLQE